MKKIISPTAFFIIVILAIISINWYGRINIVRYKTDTYKSLLSSKEILKLQDNSVLKKDVSDETHYIYESRTINYRITRGKFPFIYNKTIISDTGIKYTSKEIK